MVYAMRVDLPVKPGRLPEAVELMGTIMDRVRREDGCLAFEVATLPESSSMFIYESYVSRAYHDDVHESYPEVIALLAAITELVDGTMDIREMDLQYSRESGAQLLDPPA